MPFLPPNQQRQSTEGNKPLVCYFSLVLIRHTSASSCSHYSTGSLNIMCMSNLLAYTTDDVKTKTYKIIVIITHRHSIAKQGGCFQWHLFVYQHYNFQTIKRRMMKLGSYMHCTKISSEFECGVTGPTPRSPHPKMWRFAEPLCKKSTNGCGHGRLGISK